MSTSRLQKPLSTPPVTPNQLGLWRANSLSELYEEAAHAGLFVALAQPVSVILRPPAYQAELDRLRGQIETLGELPLGDFMLERRRWQALKALGNKEERRALLRACRVALETAPPAAVGRPVRAAPGALPLDPDALEDWLLQAGLTDLLDEHSSVLLEDLPRVHFDRLGYHASYLPSLGELLYDLPFRVTPRANKEDVKVLQSAAERHVRRRVAEAEAALRQEPAAAPPFEGQHPVLLELAQKLLALREALRRRHAPVPRAQLSGTILRLRPEPLSLFLEAPVKLRDKRRGGQRPKVELGLTDWKREISTRCDCPWQDGGCRHALQAVDVALLVFEDPDTELVRELATQLSVPHWGKVLAQVRLVARPQASAAEDALEGARLVWRLSPPKRHGTPKLEALIQRPSARGGWANGRALRPEEILRSVWSQITDLDRTAATLLSGYDGPSRLPQALDLLAPTGRVLLAGHPEPLRVRKEALGIACLEKGDGFELIPMLGASPVPEELERRLLGSGPMARHVHLDVEGGTCVVAHASAEVQQALAILNRRGNTFPKEAADALADELEEAAFPVVLPAVLCGREVAPSTAAIVHLTRPEPLTLEVELRVQPLPGALSFPVGQGPDRVRGRDGDGRLFCVRAFDAERAAALALCDRLGLPPPSTLEGRTSSQRVEADAALALVQRLEAEAKAGLEVRWPPKRPTVGRAATKKDLKVRVTEGRDWFGLSGDVEVDGARVDLAVLLEAARARRAWVKAGDDHFVELSEELRAQLEPLADVTFDGKHGQEITVGAAPTLQALAEEVGGFEACASFGSLLTRMKEGEAASAEVPSALQADLRPYQKEGFEWLSRLAGWGAGACLADDMGLGKTLQALALLTQRARQGPALVVAPTSVCFNWEAEAQRFSPSLRVHAWRTCDRDALPALLGPNDVVVVSYGLLVRDLDKLRAVPFTTLVLDEAQAVKNAHSQRAKAVREVQAAFRVALSGTPLENNLGELWSLFRVVLPGLFGSEEQFKKRFWIPIERSADAQRQRALSRLIRPFLLRRTKAEVATELPPRTEVTLPVALSPAERRLYDDARLAAVADLSEADGEDARFKVLAALTRLRLLACHPVLHDAGWRGPASKLGRFVELVEELRAQGHRALVFSQFVKHLAVVREALKARGFRFQYLDGETPAEERRRRVEAFQRGEGDLFLISLKAGGTGLNLTGADNVIHLDPWWNPAVEDQATDRAHRIGQQKPVTVYRLVAKGTIEEQILALHAQKRELVAGVLDGTGQGARLEVSEMVALLAEGAREDGGDEEDPGTLGAELAEALTLKEDDLPPAPAKDAVVEGAVSHGAMGARLIAYGPALASLPAEFRGFMEEEAMSGRIGRGPVKTYSRAVERFCGWLADGGGISGLRPQMRLRDVRDLYLAALVAGQWDAPASEPGVARSALAKLAAYLEA